jgi:hypothetical protein
MDPTAEPARDRADPSRPRRLAVVARILGLWAAWAALTLVVAWILLHTAVPRGGHGGLPTGLRHGLLAAEQPVPSLFRWDAVWYLAVARDLYAPAAPSAERTTAFLPLFPLLVRATSEASGLGLVAAAASVPLAMTLFALLAFAGYLRSAERAEGGELWQPLLLLLAWPGGFLLLAPYAESTFLVLALVAFWAARAGRPGWAAAAAFLAGLTRIHGLALAAALAWLAWERRREWRTLGLLPPVAALVGLGSYLLFLQQRFGDPLLYWRAKNTFLSGGLYPPWRLPAAVSENLQWALSEPRLGAVQVVLEPVAAVLVLAAALALLRRRRVPEAVYLLAALALSVAGGSFWGLLRYSLPLFPLFVVGARLGRFPLAWGLTLLAAGMAQLLLLFQYVHSVTPAP